LAGAAIAFGDGPRLHTRFDGGSASPAILHCLSGMAESRFYTVHYSFLLLEIFSILNPSVSSLLEMEAKSASDAGKQSNSPVLFCQPRLCKKFELDIARTDAPTHLIGHLLRYLYQRFSKGSLEHLSPQWSRRFLAFCLLHLFGRLTSVGI
jgi:hypothetical protein